MSIGLLKFSTFIGSAFAAVIEVIAAVFPKRLAYGIALIAISVGLLATFFLAIKAAMLGLSMTITNQGFLIGFYMFYSNQVQLAMSAYMTAWVVKFVYTVHKTHLQLLLF
jgi:hypothetical protein